MATLDDQVAALAAPQEFERALALETLRTAAFFEERPGPDAPEVARRLVGVVARPVDDLERVVELLADLCASPRVVAALAPEAGKLVWLLTAPEGAVRLAALPLLARLPEASSQTQPVLQRAALEDEDQRVRLGALLALATLRADVSALAHGLYTHEADALDRFVAALALLLQGHPVSGPMLDFALTSLRERALLLRCGDVPLVDNPRVSVALAMVGHPDAALRVRALDRQIEQLEEDWWLDDDTASALLELGKACGSMGELRALHLVASRTFGPNGSLDLVEVLQRHGWPTDPAALQRRLGGAFPIGLPARPQRSERRPWWRFW